MGRDDNQNRSKFICMIWFRPAYNAIMMTIKLWSISRIKVSFYHTLLHFYVLSISSWIGRSWYVWKWWRFAIASRARTSHKDIKRWPSLQFYRFPRSNVFILFLTTSLILYTIIFASYRSTIEQPTCKYILFDFESTVL